MARHLKELKTFKYNGKTWVRLEFTTGEVISNRAYSTSRRAMIAAGRLRDKWWNDLIANDEGGKGMI